MPETFGLEDEAAADFWKDILMQVPMSCHNSVFFEDAFTERKG